MLTCKPCRSPAAFDFLLVGLCCVRLASCCLFFEAMQVSVSNVDSRKGYCQRPVCMHIWLLNALMDKLKKKGIRKQVISDPAALRAQMRLIIIPPGSAWASLPGEFLASFTPVSVSNKNKLHSVRRSSRSSSRKAPLVIPCDDGYVLCRDEDMIVPTISTAFAHTGISSRCLIS